MERLAFGSRRRIGLGVLLLVSVVCFWLARERRVVMARQAARQVLEDHGVEIEPGTGAVAIPWTRVLFGDEPIQSLDISLQKGQLEVEEAAAWFPEADIWDEKGEPGAIDLTGPSDDSAGDLFED